MRRRERRATARGSQSSAELYQAGLRHMEAGRHLDAQICCKQALAADPDHADILHLMGILCHRMQQYDHALEWISRAIRQDPRPLHLSNLGSTLQSLGRREEALQAFDKAVQLKPDADSWVNLGNILVELERPIDAVLSFQHALKLNPRHWDAANKSGFVFYGLQDFEAALTQFDLCDTLQPNQALTLQARALAFRGLRRFEESLADNLRSYEINPDIIETRNNIGDALRSLERHEEALQWFDKALELQPNHIGALNNKAFLLGQMHRFDEAFAMYDRMKALNQSNAATDWNLGLLHMMTGNFEAGWIGREARWNTPDVLPAAYPKFAQPMWLGKEPIDGKTILIRIDEGLGDSIQFARYVPMVAARGARVILVVAEAVHPLLSKLPGVSQCVPVTTEGLPAFDMHCPMCSLPLAFGTRLDTIPSGASYLPTPDAALVQAWEQRLGPRKKLRVGLVWSGNPKHGNDHNRSIPLRTLAPILDTDATFVSLQKDPRADDQMVLRERAEILDLTADLTDFVETAALINCLDLVITVDTSVAHLAGALGCPTWILLPYVPDYRWLLDRDDSPWYPTVRLFRQNETREYDGVLDRVRNELQTLIVADRDRNAPGGKHPALTSGLATITADALCEAGFRHLRSGQNLDAHNCGEQALAVDSGHADSLHLLGLQSLQTQQYDHAIEWISHAIRQDPKPEYLASLGTALRHQGRHDEALQTFDKAVQLKPDDADLWQNLGEVLFTLKRPADALLSFQHALKLNPRHWGASHNSGLLRHQQGRFEEALNHFDACNELRPDNIPTLRMRAVLLRELKRFEESLLADQQLYALNPDDIETCHNIGALLRVLGRYEEALEWFDKTLALQPNLIQALNNKASSLAQLQRFDEAFAVYDHTKALGLSNALTDWNLALLHMLTGNFEAGWAGREARWHIPAFSAKYPAISGPKWLGDEPLDGKTILICVDEGLGDAIQFARYLPMLAARGARVILAVQEPLCVLLSAVPGVSQCVPISPTASVPPFDFHCPMSSLPLAFGTRLGSIPADVSYLPRPDQARVQAWETRLGPHNRLRVGLVWSGNPDHLNDRHRSITLQTFSRILDADATFISLQKDIRAGDKTALLERTDIVDLTAHLSDFTETAALVSCLDLIITVDTSVAHLAGALGRQTWILLPHTPDYRWLLDRDDSPWYPTVRLFRQTETRDYREVLDRVRSELQTLIVAQRDGAAPGEQHPAPIIASATTSANALCAAGVGHLQAGRSPDARICCQQALAIDPNHADSLHLMGFLSLQAQQYDQAVEWISRAILQDPKQAYISSLGTTLQRQGRYEEALKAHDKAVQLKPDDAELWKNLGDILFQLERQGDALLSYQHALKLDPQHWDATYRSAFVLYQMGRIEESFKHVELCNTLRPNQAEALQLRGLLQRSLKRYDEYLADSLAAHELVPNDAENQNNIGDALQAFGRYEEAISWFDRALRLRPNYLFALINKGSSLQRLQRFDEAEAIYHHTKAIAPGYAEADFNLALLQLLHGNFELGERHA